MEKNDANAVNDAKTENETQNNDNDNGNPSSPNSTKAKDTDRGRSNNEKERILTLKDKIKLNDVRQNLMRNIMMNQERVANIVVSIDKMKNDLNAIKIESNETIKELNDLCKRLDVEYHYEKEEKRIDETETTQTKRTIDEVRREHRKTIQFSVHELPTYKDPTTILEFNDMIMDLRRILRSRNMLFTIDWNEKGPECLCGYEQNEYRARILEYLKSVFKNTIENRTLSAITDPEILLITAETEITKKENETKENRDRVLNEFYEQEFDSQYRSGQDFANDFGVRRKEAEKYEKINDDMAKDILLHAVKQRMPELITAENIQRKLKKKGYEFYELISLVAKTTNLNAETSSGRKEVNQEPKIRLGRTNVDQEDDSKLEPPKRGPSCYRCGFSDNSHENNEIPCPFRGLRLCYGCNTVTNHTRRECRKESRNPGILKEDLDDIYYELPAEDEHRVAMVGVPSNLATKWYDERKERNEEKYFSYRRHPDDSSSIILNANELDVDHFKEFIHFTNKRLNNDTQVTFDLN